jgi:hypothetical protein
MLKRTILRLTAAGALGVLLNISGPIDEARAGEAQARNSGAQRVAERGQRATRPNRPQAPRGDWSRHTETRRTDTGHSSHTTWQGENGKTATRDAVVVNDREAGTRTRDVTHTSPEGKTRTVSDVTQRTDAGYTRDTTVTGPDGKTGTRSVVVNCDKAAGNCTRDVQVDRPN